MKQAIVARGDIGMGAGKLAAQVAHAALLAAEEVDDDVRRAWKADGQRKIVLEVDGEQPLHELADVARREGVAHAVVRDAGHTELEPGTVTALGVGPAEGAAVDRVTGDLPLY